MTKDSLMELLMDHPVIAAVKSDEELEKALGSSPHVVFVLYGDIIGIDRIVARIKDAGKIAFVHVDLIEGLAAREIAVEFIARHTGADGIISTKPVLVRHAKACGLVAIQRFFLLDSLAFLNIQKQLMQRESFDFMEILPGVMPKIVRKLTSFADRPLIAGGLISDKEDIMNALGAGAVAVSSTDPDTWSL